MSYFVVLSCGRVFVLVLCPDSLWLLFYNSKYQALDWLDWVHYSSKYQALVAQAAAWSPVISLTGDALSPLFSSQALLRPDFDHPPVLQHTALSYCLDSHFSPVNLSLVNKRHSLDYSASGSLSSKLVWQIPDRTNQPSPDPAEWVLKLFHLPLQKGDRCSNGQWHRFDSRAGIHGALLNSFGPWLGV